MVEEQSQARLAMLVKQNVKMMDGISREHHDLAFVHGNDRPVAEHMVKSRLSSIEFLPSSRPYPHTPRVLALLFPPASRRFD